MAVEGMSGFVFTTESLRPPPGPLRWGGESQHPLHSTEKYLTLFHSVNSSKFSASVVAVSEGVLAYFLICTVIGITAQGLITNL